MVRELWPAARGVVVQYDDEDGDRITVGTEREWTEALHLHAAAMARASDREVPLRLFVQRRAASAASGGGSGPQAPAPRDGSDGSDAAAPMHGTPPASEAGAHGGEARCCSPAPMPASCGASECGAEAPVDGVAGEPPRYLACDTDRRMLALLSALYACDAGEELLAEAPRVDFGMVAQRCCDAATGRVEVDVQLDALAHAAHVAALTLLDELDAERAADVLQLACAVFPRDATMRYNAGCALAMCGRRADALDALEHATQLGYRDGDRMQRDPDLASLHAEERFHAIVRSMRAWQLSAHVQRSMRASSVMPAPTVRRLRAVFPSLSVAEAEAALQRRGGDLQATVEALLGGV